MSSPAWNELEPRRSCCEPFTVSIRTRARRYRRPRRVIDSAGLWLMPPLQRTNSMAAGHRSAIATASWPAPEAKRIGGMPSAATASSKIRDEARIHRRGGRIHERLDRQKPTLAAWRRWPRMSVMMSCHHGVAHHVVGRARVEGEVDARGNDVDRAGLDLGGRRRSRPCRGGSRRCARRRRSSRRRPRARRGACAIGTVPAWPASPVTLARARVMPLIADDDADGEARGLEQRPLLDMDLEIGAVAAPCRGRSPRSRRDRRRKRRAPREGDAVPVGPSSHAGS